MPTIVGILTFISKKNTSLLWEQLATDQCDPSQVVPRQVFSPYSRMLISTAFVVISRVCCLGGNLCVDRPACFFCNFIKEKCYAHPSVKKVDFLIFYTIEHLKFHAQQS